MELKDLVCTFGVSGCEDEVRKLIHQDIEQHADDTIEDNMGNLIAIKGKGKKTIMLGAHMDEVGLMIMGIDKHGLLKFHPVGGVDQRVLLAKKISIGEKRLIGVIGATPPHLSQKKDKVVNIDAMYIDIGAKSKKEAEKLISVGDYAVFKSDYYETESFIFGKAFDDRLGCLILIRLIKKSLPGRIAYLFSVQEEVGLRGAQVATEKIIPDIFISVEATGAADFPAKDKEMGKPRLGLGPAITIADRSLIASQEMVDLMVSCAQKEKIPYQLKRPMIGGTDAGRISISKGGIKCGVVAVPVRYIHSPIGIVRKEDIQATERLLTVLINRIMEA